MQFSFYQKRLGHLAAQGKLFVGLSAFLLIVIFLQTILLFFKHEKIIISPPELKQGYWVEGDRFSNSYLEEMALLFAHFLLDVSPSSILPQGEVILRYVLPEAYGVFKTKLLSDEKRLKKQQLSLHFSPKTMEIPKESVVELTGTLSAYVGERKISQQQETYQIVFAKRKGRLFLESFELIKSQGDSDE
jgi:conjugal transfer pilus assembly protein TraE